MHRLIMRDQLTPGLQVDHVEPSASLDNRRSNLRVATPGQNCRNRRTHRTNQSGIKGVSWDERRDRYRAEIASDGRKYHLGYFDAIEAATAAYSEAARPLHGEFARMA